MQDAMTSKERWLAALRLQPVDRLPFWPKLNGAYPQAQPAPFAGMDCDAIHDWIGSDTHQGIAACAREVRSVTSKEIVQDESVMRTVFHTPYGDMQLVQKFDKPSASWHPVEFPVQTREHIKWMTAFYDDVSVELDEDALATARDAYARIGDRAVTTNAIGESPLMHWVEWLAGIENAHFLLADYRDDVEQLFEAMHRVLLRRTELLCEHAVSDVIYLVENTSTTLISPDQYRTYCVPQVGAYAALTHAAGRILILHMCGHLKAILPDLAGIPAQGFEAFTSPTLGNTTLLDGRSACPNTCLIGGTNAMLWTRPAEDIIAQIEADLGVLPHHRGIVVTSAGVMPPFCRPQTIKQVCDWVKQYPGRCD